MYTGGGEFGVQTPPPKKKIYSCVFYLYHTSSITIDYCKFFYEPPSNYFCVRR